MEYISKEGYRSLWFHSRAKQPRDAETRARKIERAERELEELEQRIEGRKTRFRSRKKIEAAAEEILQSRGVGDFVQITIEETGRETLPKCVPVGPMQTQNTIARSSHVFSYRGNSTPSIAS
ncbi:MAG: hypothetical protein KDB27_28130 [Planctomycetales bacterium]|nr:hypothetical protein [Planctomycetales bacterium]